MRKFLSINPVNNKLISTFEFISYQELAKKIKQGHEGHLVLKHEKKFTSDKLEKLATLIEQNVKKYAQLITSEMGKPIKEAEAEVIKAAKYCRYYSENEANYLKQKRVKTDAENSYYKLEPLGLTYAISPFNFPFWLCFKPIIPQILLGNSVLHRPSDSTPLTGLAIEELFQQADFQNFEFQNVFASPDQLEFILENDNVHGVSFTGSTNAGKHIASVAGKYLKRSVMELGGSDPFMAMEEADVNCNIFYEFQSQNLQQNWQLKVEQLIVVKQNKINIFISKGQVCFSSKRFIIHDSVYDYFRDLLIQRLKNLKLGDPMNSDNAMGPMARRDLVLNLKSQIEKGVSEGAKLLLNGQPKSLKEEDGNFYPPCVLECTPQNSLFRDETFGPVFPLYRAKNNKEIIKIGNDTKYGLGAVIVGDLSNNQLKWMVKDVQAGLVFVNDSVRSDFSLPSGGIKQSGFGRECAKYGIESFANIKTVWIN